MKFWTEFQEFVSQNPLIVLDQTELNHRVCKNSFQIFVKISQYSTPNNKTALRLEGNSIIGLWPLTYILFSSDYFAFHFSSCKNERIDTKTMLGTAGLRLEKKINFSSELTSEKVRHQIFYLLYSQFLLNISLHKYHEYLSCSSELLLHMEKRGWLYANLIVALKHLFLINS